ncbi:hypothetical protein PFISCL1PPCAC_10872 [Pristionchus fissidentatus]|uniref:Uncharacterized protein n=1 Tax=Pristionchus fissidentatus TaxID=1538716 RepID=A0AAV5VNM4_9BILA|nr:hypothetical protein PFISCL1PPCAC_10872 [Pristionchus fissidentatus]
MGASDALKPILFVSIGLEAVVSILVVGLCIWIFLAIKKSNVEIQKASDELPKVLDSLAYAELPMPVICAMTTYFKIDIKDVVKAYLKDAGERRKIVLDAFQMDKVTKSFLETYESKFVAHGYIGEQLLKGLGC